MTTIAASLFVNVIPSVLPAGGDQLDLIAVLGSASNRVPVGAVYSFASASAVASFFGSGSAEAVFAGGAGGDFSPHRRRAPLARRGMRAQSEAAQRRPRKKAREGRGRRYAGNR